jgi:hypothetical protein
MDPKSSSRITSPDVMRMLMLFQHGKGLKKIPRKTVEYYTEDASIPPKRIYLTRHRKQGKNAIDPLK